jgi:hypothetical protein
VAKDDDESLKRLGGGRWETRDGRFAIEPQSGTWVVVDSEQTDDLGLPLVRGPFPSLTAAKAAIAEARTSAPQASPLAERLADRQASPKTDDRDGRPTRSRPGARAGGPSSTAQAPERDSESTKAPGPDTRRPKRPSREAREEPKEPEPREPSWFADLAPEDRGRARRLIERLTESGVSDAESIVRRDLAGGVPALAAHAIERRLEELGDDATPSQLVRLLADGRDDGLGVRWRIVDGDGRPVVIDVPRRAKGPKR